MTFLPTEAYAALGALAQRKGFSWWWDNNFHCNLCDTCFEDQNVADHGMIHIKEYGLVVFL